MKNVILLSIILIILGACSSIPDNDQSNSIDTLIEKPNFNYKIRSLPKQLNLYFFADQSEEGISYEVQGFLANAYFYRNKIKYLPKIKIIRIENNKCIIQEQLEGFSIVFETKKNKLVSNNSQCLEGLKKSETFYVTNSRKDLQGYKYNFVVSRESEKKVLMNYIKDSDQRFVVIDSNTTNDAKIISNELILKDKEVVETTTFKESMSSQNLFSKLMMADRSKERTRKLSRRISRQLAGEIRVRDDIDTFFLSVGLKDARNLKPALDYISAKNFNIFMLNSWEENETYNYIDNDLEDTLNSDMPIMMPINLPAYIPDIKRNRGFAVGYDSFEIVMLSFGGINTKDFLYKGLSGRIKINRKEVEREPYIFRMLDEGIEIL